MKSRIVATSATRKREVGAGRISGPLVVTALAWALTSCASAGSDTAESPVASSAPAGASPSASARGDQDERITPAGIAVIVREHLGRDAVQQFFTYEPEPGDVSVMIKLRGGRRDGHFAVSVYSPKHDEFAGMAGKCPPKRRMKGMGTSQCRTLENGTTVMTKRTPYGFSDDNANGTVVMGTAATRGNGTAMAMYESYDDSPSIGADDLEGILTDPRLTWHTDPAVNEAGDDIDVKERAG